MILMCNLTITHSYMWLIFMVNVSKYTVHNLDVGVDVTEPSLLISF